MIIYLVTDIRRKFDMLVHTKEALEAGQQQGDTLKSSITDFFVRLLWKCFWYIMLFFIFNF